MHDGVDAMLEGGEGFEGLERFAQEDEDGMAPLAHGEGLEVEEGEVFGGGRRGEAEFGDDELVLDLSEVAGELGVGSRGVEFVAGVEQRGFGGCEPLGCAEQGQGGPVSWADEIEFRAHGYLRRRLGAGVGGGGAAGRWSSARSMRLVIEVVDSPRFFLMLSMPRWVGPRRLQ